MFQPFAGEIFFSLLSLFLREKGFQHSLYILDSHPNGRASLRRRAGRPHSHHSHHSLAISDVLKKDVERRRETPSPKPRTDAQAPGFTEVLGK
jgi:hypothetical protein